MSRESTYQAVTADIVAAIEAGAPPWEPRFDGGAQSALPLRVCGTPYRGINVLALWVAAERRGHCSPHWMTYRQAQELGGQVRKGEKACKVIKAGKAVSRDTRDLPEDEQRHVAFMRQYAVFNVEQIDGLPDRFAASPAPVPMPSRSAFSDWFGRTGIELRVTGNMRAFYDPANDYVHMPPEQAFTSDAAYAGTLLHEAVHATGHKDRVGRATGQSEREYAFEECVAEIGAAMVAAATGCQRCPIGEHAAYVDAWRKVARDPHAIVKAASAAQAASDWLIAKAGGMAIQ
ncbi:MAG: zincin-like metallopeptidase domain-containing protein [Boseongicola sp.]|nr:zincin-like metallopeptidase domain-containing protein [Boseongicola sp.]